MSSVVAFANTQDSKSIPTGTVYGSLAGGNGYANASTKFTPGSSGYYSQKAEVYIESVHQNGTQLAYDNNTGTDYDRYNAWISLRDTRAVTWHSGHGSTGTSSELYLWIAD